MAGYNLTFSASTLPAGVTASFSTNPVTVGQSTTLTVNVTASAKPVQNYPFTITVTPSVSLPTQTLNLGLDVAPAVGGIPDNRTDFIRTDATPTSLVYDAGHQLIFASNLEWNRVDVVSPVTKQIVRSIPVPAPQGMDLTLDGKQVLVGSETQQIVAIDTGSLTVVHRWYVQLQSPYLVAGQGYGIWQIANLANGKVLLIWSQVYTTGTGLNEWDPATNTTTNITLPPSFLVSGMARSADGSKVIIDSGVEAGAVDLFDSASDSIVAQKPFSGYVLGVQANPTGTRFSILDSINGLQLYDAQLNTLGLIPPGAYDTGLVFSGDGSKIYVVADSYGVPAVYTVDASSLTITGLAPAYATIPPYAELGPTPYIEETPFAVDSQGLIFGAADHGIALDDSTYFQAIFPPAATPVFDKIVQPDAGPVNAATSVQVVTSPFDAIPDAWFGSQRAANETLSGSGLLQLTAPPSAQPGPVNLKLIQPNGVQVFDPLAYSYGPAPLFLSGNSGAPGGGASADIIAVGVPADPASIQVAVGGVQAEVVSAKDFSSAFPDVDINVKLPAGTTGSADVTVTTSAGSATLPKAFRFVQSVTDYASSDTFQAILYDRFRNQLYLSAGDHVDVFSLTSNQFGASLHPPSVGGTKLFGGAALTPDGSKLLVTNVTDGSVAIVNPDNPSASSVVAIAPVSPTGTSCHVGPEYVATTNTGKAFIIYGGIPGIACSPGEAGIFYELDLSTMAVNGPPIDSCPQQVAFASSSRDGSLVAFGGSISSNWAVYNSATGTCSSASFYQAYGAAVAGDGNIFAAGFRITDSQANLLNIIAFPDPYYPGQFPGTAQGNGVQPLYEEKMNDAGSLLYVPFPNTVDIFDVAHAFLAQRVTLSEQIAQVVDALAIDPTGQHIYLITDKGLTIVELDAAPLSVGSITPATGAAGTQITLRGSGFIEGTTARLNGTAAPVTFVDVDTLQLAVPSLPSGAVQIQLANSDGSTYSLDDAFTVQ